MWKTQKEEKSSVIFYASFPPSLPPTLLTKCSSSFCRHMEGECFHWAMLGKSPKLLLSLDTVHTSRTSLWDGAVSMSKHTTFSTRLLLKGVQTVALDNYYMYMYFWFTAGGRLSLLKWDGPLLTFRDFPAAKAPLSASLNIIHDAAFTLYGDTGSTNVFRAQEPRAFSLPWWTLIQHTSVLRQRSFRKTCTRKPISRGLPA